MSIQKKTLAVLVAASLGMSFGASAGDRGGWGGGGYEDPECCTGGTNTNDDGNQAVDDSTVYDVDLDYKRLTKTINKDILNGWDNSVKIKLDSNINHQSNFTFQGGHTGGTNSVSLAGSSAGSQAGNLGLMGQHSENDALGAGVGFGAGLGAASSEANGGGTNGKLPYGQVKKGGRYGGHEDGGSDVDSGDAGGAGFGAGMGMGVGWAKLTADQDLDQSAAAFSHSGAYSVSMIKSGDNTLGNSGSMYGINVQQGISGHSAMGNQSVNVNSSVQF